MYLIGWKPVADNLSMPSVRIRCANIIRHVNSDRIRLELFQESNFASRYDAVIFSKNYYDDSIKQAEALKAAGKKVIFDLFDNRFFLADDTAETKEAEGKLRHMLSLADHITTSTTFLRDALSNHIPGRDITPIEDALEEKLYVGDSFLKSAGAWAEYIVYRAKLAAHPGKLRLIWFGTSGDKRLGTGMSDMIKLQSVLEKRNDIVLTVCSSGKKMFQEIFGHWKIPVIFINWNAATFYNVLRCNKVALIPITPNPLTQYKTNNRILTSLYNGLAVIAEDIPSYREFAHCIILNDWEKGLATYRDEAARKRDVMAGCNIIAKKYLPQQIAARWEQFLSGVFS